jgi:hypothetical protein
MTGKGAAMDIGAWLRELGLGQYEAAFRENEIDETVLASLTHETLKELGVKALGPRLKLLDAIALLRADGSAKAPPAEASSTFLKPAQDTAERRHSSGASPAAYSIFGKGVLAAIRRPRTQA